MVACPRGGRRRRRRRRGGVSFRRREARGGLAILQMSSWSSGEGVGEFNWRMGACVLGIELGF